MTGTFERRRPVGVGRVPAHSAATGVASLGRGEPALHGRAVLLALRLGLGRVVVLGRAPLARRLDARRLALLLAVVRRPRRVAEALAPRPPPRAPGAPRASRPPRRSRRPGRRSSAKRAGTVAIVNASASRVGTSSQRERRRDPRVRERPDRVRRGDRPVLRVLVVVEEHAVALLLPPLRGGDRRRPPLDVARDREGGPANLRVRPLPLDADVDVDAARAGRLRPADEPDGLQRLLA